MQKAVWIRLVLIGILLLQIPIISIPLTKTPLHEKAVATPKLPLPDVNLDTQVTCVLNTTHSNPLFRVPISDPGLYNFTLTFAVNYSDPWAGVNFYLTLYDSADEYQPQLDQYFPIDRQFEYNSWWMIFTGFSSQHVTEFMVVQTGFAFVELELGWNTPWDQVIANFTVSQQYSFTDATSTPLAQPTNIQWTEDNAWNVTKFTIPSNDLYNITLVSHVPYSTTAGSSGVSDFYVFETLALFDLVYGAYLGYSQWTPTCNIPAGPAVGIATWIERKTIPLPAGDYHLVGKSNPFLFLNGTYVELTVYVEQVSTLALGANESLTLAFDASAPVNDVYVAVTVPGSSLIDFYLNNPEGGNWSIASYDALNAFLTPPTYDYYVDPTFNVTVETHYQYAVSLNQPVSTFNPCSGLLGERYFEPYMFQGTEVLYLDGVPQWATFPVMGGPMNFWNTFFLVVQGTPGFIGPPSATFNISLNLDSTPLTQLTPATDLVVPINQTIGPFYHGFLLPVESGVTYDIRLTPNYTANGAVMLQLLSASGQFYHDWGFGSGWPLYKAVGISGIMAPGVIAAFNVNDTAALRFIAVRNATLLVVAMGTHPMLGPSDTNELKVSISATEPTDYTIGSDYDVTTTTTEYDFTGFNVPVIAGYRYQISLTIDYGSMFAAGIFFDDDGHTPFDIGMHGLWAIVDHRTVMTFTGTYMASQTGIVTFALIHEGTARFSITLIDDQPPVVEILAPEWAASFESGDIIINFTASDEIGLASLVIGTDGTEESIPVDSTSYTYTALNPGVHLIYIRAEDTQGNTATDSVAILILPDPASWTLGRDAAYIFMTLILIGAVAGTGVICFLLGWFIKGRRKP